MKNIPIEKYRWSGISIALALLAIFILYFAGLGSYPLVDPDEPIYGQFVKEMAAGSSWLTPHYNGKLWFDKPPLFYWEAALCSRILGTSEFSTRLPSAILAVVLIFLVYCLVKYDFGRRAAVFSSIVMATCIHQIILARAAVTDVTFAACLLSAIYAYRRWLDSEKASRFGWMALCGAMAGLGMLTKGPVAPVLLFAAFFIHLVWTRRLMRLLSLDALLGVILALLVGVPWFATMLILNREQFYRQFIVENNLSRFSRPLHQGVTGSKWTYLMYVPVFFGFFFPWSAFVPAGITRLRSSSDGAKLAIVWSALIFVFFSLSSTKLVTYVFPMYPMAALFVGVLWDRAASANDGAARSIRRGLIANGALAVLIAAALIVIAHTKYPNAQFAAGLMGLTLVAMLGVAIIQARIGGEKGLSRAALVMGAGMVLFTSELVFGLAPIISDQLSTQWIARTIPRTTGARTLEYNLFRPSILYYMNIQPEHVPDADTARRLLGESKLTYIICKEKDEESIQFPGSVECAERGGLVVISNESVASSGETKRVDQQRERRLTRIQ